MELLDRIAGRSLYTADIALPGMCDAALVRSPHPHARIEAVELAAARALPGVLGAFAAADLPRRRHGRRVVDIPILADGEVRFTGEPVAVVVATTRELAEAAADQVLVEYEELPASLTAAEAARPGAPLVHAAAWELPGAVVRESDGRNLQSITRHGDRDAAERALEAAAHRVDATYTTPAGHQGYLEPQACVASFADGRLEIWMANKSPYRLRQQLAECLELEPASIRINPVALGADFGGKGSPMHAPLCAELSRRLGRPVRLVLRYGEDLTATNPRHSAAVRVRLGCDAQGHFTGALVESLVDGGAYAGYKPRPAVDLHGLEEAGTAYRLPAAHAEVRIAYTHTVPRGHMRSPGAPQAIFAFESAVDELASAAGIDPVELRRRNLIAGGEPDWHGHVAVEARGAQTLEAALAAWRPLPVPAGWRHGRGVALYNRGTGAGHTSLRLGPDPVTGGVLVEVPMPENGAGAHGVVRRALAGLLDLRPEAVRVVQVDTGELPHDDGVGGSRVTGALSHALPAAAEAFRRADMEAAVTVEVRPSGMPPVTSYCAQVAQVAVDLESGQVRVLEVLTAIDVAAVLNPPAHRLQVEGAAAMGYGFACLEDLEVAEGRVWAGNLGEFKLPSARDVPAWRTVLVEGGVGIGGLGIKAVGELANVPTAPAIANAVAAACGARVRDLPVTAERVLAQL